jgi:beta-carotene 15,15'-dioxygenase
LAVLLLHNYDEVMKLLALFADTSKLARFLEVIGTSRYSILTSLVAFFLASTFFYFIKTKPQEELKGNFLLHFVLIILILFNLSLLQAFTFYFVIWHSLLSLKNIVGYLKTLPSYSGVVVFKQIVLYSLLAIAGIGIIAVMGYMWSSISAMVICTFFGLAVLTAPHMQVMYEMYKNIRTVK